MPVEFDIERLFREKRPAVAKRIPRVGYALLRRVLRERVVHDVLAGAGDRQGYDFVRYLLDSFDIRVRIEGESPPADTRYTICANHPTGGWDSLSILFWLEQWHPNSVLLANDVLSAIEGLRPLLFPVDVFAKSRKTLHALGQLYASDSTIVVFPAGRTSRPGLGGALQEYPWDRMFVRKSRQCDRRILPVHVSGHNTNGFYRIWRWRQRMGIDKTIEMFLLVDEMLKRRGQEIVLTIAPPQNADALVLEHGDDQTAADWLRAYTQTLGKTS